ncbi:MAG: FecR domain-containing protein, partial [Verrucomicrobiota bacterium]
MDSSKNETEALLRYLHGDMASSESQDWQQRLMGDESLRKRLIELSIEESALIDWAKTERASILLDDETFQTSRPSKMAKTRRAPHRVSAGWWAAAAVLIIGLTSILWSMLRTAPTGSPSLAYLVATINAEWQGVSPALHTSLPAGEYELTRGSIDLLFTDGARVSVSGPARFQLKGIRHLHLKSGNLVAQIPDEALGFIVTSPQSEVVDLGTEFGLSVSEAGNTDVHVLDGLVEVLPKQAGPSDRVMIFGGKARRFQGDSGERSTEIPIASREGLIGIPDVNELGLRLLRGSVRVAEGISRDDLVRSRSRGNWIDLVAEQQAVILTDPLDLTLNAPGSYRHFNIHQTLPAGTRVDSYLLHFRPSSKKQVR